LIFKSKLYKKLLHKQFMQKGLKTLGLGGLTMKQEPEQKSGIRNTLSSILGGFNTKFTAAITVLALGFGAGIVYNATTDKNDHIGMVSGHGTVFVQESHNQILGSYNCITHTESPKPGEIAMIYDDGCNHTVDKVKLFGVRSEIPYNRLSQQDQDTSSRIINNVSYKLP
jgi:hypothetical protein